MAGQHPFDLATALEPDGEDRWIARTSDAYWNMVGPFGGLVGALLFKSAYAHPKREGEGTSVAPDVSALVHQNNEDWRDGGALDLSAG